MVKVHMQGPARSEHEGRRPDASPYEIAVVANALDLLTAVGRSNDGAISAAQASKILGISRSTAYRLLVTLKNRGFVETDEASKRWRFGAQMFSLMGSATPSRLRSLAEPAMTRIWEQEKETVNLATMIGGQLTYVHILESPRSFRMSAAPGLIAPLHATALGKAFLAFLPPQHRQRALEGLRLVPITEKTVVDMKELVAELNLTAERGWAEEHGETEQGVACAGAAILDATGLPIAGISVSVPEARLTPERMARICMTLRAEAAAITKGLGYDGSSG
jgi:DNA-binding IclR family transcriptional regulator